jgi:Bacterial extracellular solute-binding protein
LAPTASDAAEIKVLTTRAMNHVLTELAGAFQRTSEHKVALILAPPAEIKRRIVNGEIVDVAISARGRSAPQGATGRIQVSRHRDAVLGSWGPQGYSGRTMEESHAHLAITPSEWDAFIDAVETTLDKFSVPAAELDCAALSAN